MRRKLSLFLVGVGVLVACNDQGPDSLAPTTRVQHAISQSGNGHFFWLPPLVATTTTNGTFNPRLAPVVEICQLTTYNGTCTGSLVLQASTTVPGPQGEKVLVNPAKQYYLLEWNTGAYQIPNETVFRIFVAGEANAPTKLGYIDVVVSTNQSILNAAPSKQTVGVLRGKVLQIKFRIEDGALCAPGSSDCFETSFTSTTDSTFVNPDSTAGVDIDPGSLPAGQSVNLVIERYTGPERCLPINELQYEGCYRIYTVPHVTLLNTAQVNICLEDAVSDFANEIEMWKWSEDPQNPQLMKVAPAQKPLFLTCQRFQVASAQSQGRWQGFAHTAGRVLQPLARVFGPQQLYAASTMVGGPLPFGGTLSDFSRIGVIRPVSISIQSGNGQIAKPGQAVANAPTVKVTSDVTQGPAAGVEVQFAVQSGNGIAAPTSTLTDVGGLASTQWTLGTAGSQSLQATVLSDPGFPNQPTSTPSAQTRVDSVTFVALATQYNVLFKMPLGTSTGGSPNWVSNLTPTIEICLLANGQCTQTVATVPVTEISFARRVYEGVWAVPGLDTSALYRVRILVNGLEIGGTNFGAVTGSPSLGHVQINSSLKILFTVELL